jgi:NAD+ synthase (glutamine-hydrolysing)
MCRVVIKALEAGNSQVEADVRRIASWGEEKLPSTAEELCNRVLHCVYM